MNLTELERKALECLWKSSDGNGHDFGYTDEIRSIEKSSRGGVVASLLKKGLIWVEGDPSCGSNQFGFTKDGESVFEDFCKSCKLR